MLQFGVNAVGGGNGDAGLVSGWCSQGHALRFRGRPCRICHGTATSRGQPLGSGEAAERGWGINLGAVVWLVSNALSDWGERWEGVIRCWTWGNLLWP